MSSVAAARAAALNAINIVAREHGGAHDDTFSPDHTSVELVAAAVLGSLFCAQPFIT